MSRKSKESILELITKQDKVLTSVRYWFAFAVFSLSLIYILAVSIFAIHGEMTRKSTGDSLDGTNTIPAVDYLEDPRGIRTLEEVELQTQWRPGSEIHIGNSRSYWWVRIHADDLKKVEPIDRGIYLSILTPSIEKGALYLPIQTEAGVTYTLLEAGWGIPRERHKDIHFSYPTFRVDENLASGRYVYLRLNSVYTQNYTFKIYTEEALSAAQKVQTAMLAFFVGFLLAIGLSNLIQYSALGVFTNLYYVIYLIMIVLYQMSVQGLSRLVFGNSAEFLIEWIAPLGIAMFISGLLFFQSSLGLRRTFPLAFKATGVLLAFFILTFIAFFTGFRYEANLLTILFADIFSTLILVTTFLAIRKKFSYAKFLFAGFTITLLSSIVFHLRFAGVFPNNELTASIILLPHATEAILLSLGIAELMDQTRSEKQQAVQMYHLAEGQVLTRKRPFSRPRSGRIFYTTP